MNSQRGLINPLLLALVALLLIGGGAYVYNQYRIASQPNVGSIQLDNSSGILVERRSLFENLSPEEKEIVSAYQMKDDPSAYSSDYALYYYDSTKVLIGRLSPTGKGIVRLHLVNRKDWEEIDSFWLYGGYVESKKYLISVDNDGIFYYRAGDSVVSSVTNSKLTSGETYQESPGAGGGTHVISFDEPTKTLTTNVYRGDLYGNGSGQKIRTVKFVLR